MMAGSVTLIKRALEFLSLKADVDGLFRIIPEGDYPKVTLFDYGILLSWFNSTEF